MHRAETVEQFLVLRETGLGARRIARELGLPLSTVRDWCAGRLPTKLQPGHCSRCGQPEHDLAALGSAYAYLLGLYLGDGCLSSHRRGVYKLRVVLDARYPGIVTEALAAMEEVKGASANWWPKPKNCIEVYAYSKAWACLLPHHAPGKKHEREIELANWQIPIVKRGARQFLRGLIHSDGCRFQNTGRDGWRASRYAFYNLSEDIRLLFCWACEVLDLRWTESGDTVYVSRKADVARMDEFIGPKA